MSNEKLFESGLTHIKCPSGAPGIKKKKKKINPILCSLYTF